MATPDKQSVGDSFAAYIDDLSVRHIFLLGLWIFSHLLHMLVRSSKEFLKRCFFDTWKDRQPLGEEEIPACESETGFASAPCSSDTWALESGRWCGSLGVLISSLPDEIVTNSI